PDGVVGIYQPDAGILNADRCVATLAAEARRHRATIREDEPAMRIATDGAGVTVRTSAATYGADRLVIAVGSWARPLPLQVGLNLPLTVTREQVAFFAPRDPTQFEPGRFPIFVHHAADRHAGYGFPVFGLPGVKVAFHHTGPEVEPDSDERTVDPARL